MVSRWQEYEIMKKNFARANGGERWQERAINKSTIWDWECTEKWRLEWYGRARFNQQVHTSHQVRNDWFPSFVISAPNFKLDFNFRSYTHTFATHKQQQQNSTRMSRNGDRQENNLRFHFTVDPRGRNVVRENFHNQQTNNSPLAWTTEEKQTNPSISVSIYGPPTPRGCRGDGTRPTSISLYLKLSLTSISMKFSIDPSVWVRFWWEGQRHQQQPHISLRAKLNNKLDTLERDRQGGGGGRRSKNIIVKFREKRQNLTL